MPRNGTHRRDPDRRTRLLAATHNGTVPFFPLPAPEQHFLYFAPCVTFHQDLPLLPGRGKQSLRRGTIVGKLEGGLQSSCIRAMSAPRKLAAILAADVAGYSRLTGLDEEGTLERLRNLRRELINPAVSLYRGRVVKTTGDGILIEFPSVVDALRCALDVQRGMDDRNTDVPTEKRIEFRVGINVGDVVVEGEDLLGDSVNVAARLEGIAEPGGICISESAYQQVRDKVDVRFQDAGEQQLKNIARPVRTYRLRPSGAAANSRLA